MPNITTNHAITYTNLHNFSLYIFSIYDPPISLIKVNNINLRKTIDYNTSNKRWGFS